MVTAIRRSGQGAKLHRKVVQYLKLMANEQ